MLHLQYKNILLYNLMLGISELFKINSLQNDLNLD